MIITLGQARDALAEFAGKAGKCKDSDAVRLLILEAVDRLLKRGAHGNLKKWCFCLCKGCFTAPPDMEVPLKVKIDGMPEKVWSLWYEFYDINNEDLCDKKYEPGLYEEVNQYFSAYDLPEEGGRIFAVPLIQEKDDAYITIQGVDLSGREVFTCPDNKEQITGEKLKISKTKPTISKTVFKKITGIEKSKTNSHVRLYWQLPGDVPVRGLLGEYRPTDTYPSFRRFRIPSAKTDCCVKVSVLGRVKLLDYYHDNDILPITSFPALRKMCQLIQAERNERMDIAVAHEAGIERLLDDENQYYRTGGEPFDFFFDTSPGANENLQ